MYTVVRLIGWILAVGFIGWGLLVFLAGANMPTGLRSGDSAMGWASLLAGIVLVIALRKFS